MIDRSGPYRPGVMLIVALPSKVFNRLEVRCPLVLFYFALLATRETTPDYLVNRPALFFLTFLNEGDPRQLIKRVKFKGTTVVSDLTAGAVRIFQGHCTIRAM